jgi:hypothetical protein
MAALESGVREALTKAEILSAHQQGLANSQLAQSSELAVQAGRLATAERRSSMQAVEIRELRELLRGLEWHDRGAEREAEESGQADAPAHAAEATSGGGAQPPPAARRAPAAAPAAAEAAGGDGDVPANDCEEASDVQAHAPAGCTPATAARGGGHCSR